MKFEFHIPKIGNKFFFIQNFGEWHHSNRKSSNNAWIQRTWPITKVENKAIKNVRDIMQNPKYGFGEKDREEKFANLFEPFLTLPEDQVLDEVEEWVSETEFFQIKKALDIFTPRFKKSGQKKNAN